MGLKKSLLRGIVAGIVATLLVRKVGGKGTKIGALAAGSVALTTWLSGRSSTEIELEDEVAAE